MLSNSELAGSERELHGEAGDAATGEQVTVTVGGMAAPSLSVHGEHADVRAVTVDGTAGTDWNTAQTVETNWSGQDDDAVEDTATRRR